MPQEEMSRKIFDPIMKDIICLVQEQISMAGANVAAVVLVGGFGQSRYLKEQVRGTIPGHVEVLQPESAWTAVVKGAVIHGLGLHHSRLAGVGIASRVARRSYGTCLLTKYDMLKHNPKEAYVRQLTFKALAANTIDRFWSEKEEEMVVTEMCWFIQKVCASLMC